MLKRYGLAVLLALTVAVYARSLYSPFVFDDDLAITKNANVIGKEPIVLHLPRWVLLTTFRANYALGGTDPFGYHVVNLGLHLVNILLVWILLLRLTNPMAALFGAAFFSLHPLQSEAVIYISARSELLACCFGLIGMLLFEKSRYVCASLALILALFSKEIAVVFPLMIAFREFLRRESAWKYLVPVGSLGLFAGSIFATYLESADRTLGDHALLQAGQFFRYLSILILPIGQTIDHDAETLPIWYCVVAWLMLMVLVGLAFQCRQRLPMVTLGLGWMLLAVAPRFLIVTPEFMSEHHFYIPMIGAALLFSLIFQNSLLERNFQCPSLNSQKPFLRMALTLKSATLMNSQPISPSGGRKTQGMSIKNFRWRFMGQKVLRAA